MAAETATTTATMTQPAPAVVVSLAIPLLPPEKLYPTPSLLDGLPYEVEFDLRLTGCELIQTAGRLLKLPQTAMASAQILFHRYFYTKSFVKSNMEHHAMAAIFLSSKVQECPRRIRDVMNVFNHIKQLRSGKVIRPMAIDAVYSETKNKVIKAERQMLKDLGFCVHFKHPHKIIFIYLQAIECSQTVDLSQKAWNYMNDSMRTDIFLRYTPQNIACACIYLSARELKISLPESPPWFVMFGADEETIKAICVRILHLYTHQVKPQEELEKIVVDCRDKLYEDKRKAREAAAPPALAAPEPVKIEAEQQKPPPSAKTADAIIQEAKMKIMMKEDESKTGALAAAQINNLRTTKAHSNTPPPAGLPMAKYSSGHEHVPQIGACPPPSFYASQSAHPMTRHSSFNNNHQYPGHFYPPPPHHHHHPVPPYINGGHGGGYNMYGENGGGYHDDYNNQHESAAASLKKNKSAASLTSYRDHDDPYYGGSNSRRTTTSVSKSSSSSRRHGTKSRSRSRSRSPSRRHAEKRHHRSRSRNRGSGGRRSSSKGRSIENDSSDSDSDEHRKRKKSSSHKSSSRSDSHHHRRHHGAAKESSRDRDGRYRDHRERDRGQDKDHHQHSSSTSSSSRHHHRSHHKSSSSKSKRDGSSSRRDVERDDPTVADSIAAASSSNDSRYMPVYIQ